jgi:hypothetical protein
MQITRIIIISIVFLVAIGILYRITPKMSKFQSNPISSHFPEVSGWNLERRQFEFPGDFAGKFNLVFIPFLRIHQDDVDTWIPTVQKIEADIPGFIYYEMPTLTTMSALSRTFLNEGMRAGIPDSTSRQRTITLYLDKENFRFALNIPSENDIHLLLMDSQGLILWRIAGEYTQEKAASLRLFLERQAPTIESQE